MLVGALLGAVIVLLILSVIFMYGQQAMLKKLNKTLNTELNATQISLGRFVILEQERQKLRESINVNFTEQQITTLADRVSARVQTIMNSDAAAALQKMN